MKFDFRNLYEIDHEEIFRDIDFSVVFQLVLDGVIVGIVAGFFAASFRYSLSFFERLRLDFMSQTDFMSIGMWMVGVVLMGYFVYWLLKWEPISGGSGIPQIEGEMQGIFNMNAARTLIAKYIGGSLTSLGGFSVGREGPSIQVGGAAGKLIAKILRRPLRQERVLTSAGAAAGLAAAFNAPISGAIFVFEEVHKSFYPVLVIPTFTAALVSNFIASLVFGLGPSLGFTVQHVVPIDYIPYLVLLGVFLGVVGVLFNRMLVLFKKTFTKSDLPGSVKMIFTFVAVSIIGYFAGDLLGGGNEMVGQISFGYGVSHVEFLLFLMLGKMVLTSFCYGSGAQGGIFLPILVIGAAAGSFFFNLLVILNLMPNIYLGHFVICAMGGIMASSIRSPLLSILLVLEMTQSFECTYDVGIVTIIAYLVAEMLKEAPIYETLLSMMIKKDVRPTECQTFFEVCVPVVSPLIGKALKDLDFPEGTLIVSITRRGRHIVPKADSVLCSGDVLFVSCCEERLGASKEMFMG